MRLILDTREPSPHPWQPFFSADVKVEVATLETGDVTLAALEDGPTCERKTVSDLLGCLGRDRERFERELRRARHLAAFCVVCEGSLCDLLTEAHTRSGLHHNAIVGSLAAWTRRGTPFVFAGSVRLAAEFSERFLRSQIREAQRMAKALAMEATA